MSLQTQRVSRNRPSAASEAGTPRGIALRAAAFAASGRARSGCVNQRARGARGVAV